MVNSSSTELINPIWLKTPYIRIYTRDLVDSSAVYDSLPSTGQVRKQIRKFVAVESVTEKLDAKLCIWTLIGSTDESEAAFKETKTLTHRNSW